MPPTPMLRVLVAAAALACAPSAAASWTSIDTVPIFPTPAQAIAIRVHGTSGSSPAFPWGERVTIEDNVVRVEACVDALGFSVPWS